MSEWEEKLRSIVGEESASKIVTLPGGLLRGIYFLIHRGDLVYIGQSVNAFARLGAHCSDKEFDAVAFMPVTGDLDEVEASLIRMFDPKLNRGLPAAPKSFDPEINRILTLNNLMRRVHCALEGYYRAAGASAETAFKIARLWRPRKLRK